MAAAQVRGFHGDRVGAPGRVIAGPKHFAGYGAAFDGRDYDKAEFLDNELWNLCLPPFKAALEAGAGNLMSACLGLNGVPATGNRWLSTDVLREAWGSRASWSRMRARRPTSPRTILLSIPPTGRACASRSAQTNSATGVRRRADGYRTRPVSTSGRAVRPRRRSRAASRCAAARRWSVPACGGPGYVGGFFQTASRSRARAMSADGGAAASGRGPRASSSIAASLRPRLTALRLAPRSATP